MLATGPRFGDITDADDPVQKRLRQNRDEMVRYTQQRKEPKRAASWKNFGTRVKKLALPTLLVTSCVTFAGLGLKGVGSFAYNKFFSVRHPQTASWNEVMSSASNIHYADAIGDPSPEDLTLLQRRLNGFYRGSMDTLKASNDPADQALFKQLKAAHEAEEKLIDQVAYDLIEHAKTEGSYYWASDAREFIDNYSDPDVFAHLGQTEKEQLATYIANYFDDHRYNGFKAKDIENVKLILHAYLGNGIQQMDLEAVNAMENPETALTFFNSVINNPNNFRFLDNDARQAFIAKSNQLISTVPAGSASWPMMIFSLLMLGGGGIGLLRARKKLKGDLHYDALNNTMKFHQELFELLKPKRDTRKIKLVPASDENKRQRQAMVYALDAL